MSEPSTLRIADRRQAQPHATSSRFANVETCFSRVPLPPGEGGAKRRVRARNAETLGIPALIRPFGPPSPGGRRTVPRVSRLFWTALTSCRRYAAEFGSPRGDDNEKTFND